MITEQKKQFIGIDLARGKDLTTKITIYSGGRSTGRTWGIKHGIQMLQDGRVFMPKENTKLLTEIQKYTYAK